MSGRAQEHRVPEAGDIQPDAPLFTLHDAAVDADVLHSPVDVERVDVPRAGGTGGELDQLEGAVADIGAVERPGAPEIFSVLEETMGHRSAVVLDGRSAVGRAIGHIDHENQARHIAALVEHRPDQGCERSDAAAGTEHAGAVGEGERARDHVLARREEKHIACGCRAGGQVRDGGLQRRGVVGYAVTDCAVVFDVDDGAGGGEVRAGDAKVDPDEISNRSHITNTSHWMDTVIGKPFQKLGLPQRTPMWRY